MSYDLVVLLVCAMLWLIHIAQLVRLPLRRTRASLAIALFGIAVSVAAYALIPSAAAVVAAVAVAALLIVPAVATRGASRALRFDRSTKARLLATLAAVLRPIPAQRRLRRAMSISGRLARGEQVDIDEAVATLGLRADAERDAHKLVFLSWTNDFPRMARLLANEAVRKYALQAGMAALVTSVVGETGCDEDLAEHFARLEKLPLLANRNIDGTLALVCIAAYLGEVDLVRAHLDELRRDVPPPRIAYLLATAEQRAGRHAEAEQTVHTALARKDASVSARRRLGYRLEAVLPAARRDEERQRVANEVNKRLEARRALAALSLGWRRPAPLTWSLVAALTTAFIWQLSQPSRGLVFATWGLVSPYAAAPDAYRLLSYAALHADIGHLLVNLVGLLVFGRFVERHFGRWRYLVLYLAGAIVGGVSYLAFSLADGVAIGASGAVLAMYGATVARIGLDKALRSSKQGRRELIFLGAVAVLQLVVDLVWAQSSGSAHAGGLVSGLILGAALLKRPRQSVVRGS